VGAGRVRLIAWVLWLASLALVALGLLFLGLGASTPVPPGFGFRGVNVVFSVAFSTVGAVLTLRRPDTPIGWLFATVGLGFAVGAFTYDYGVYAVLANPGLPLGPEAAWATQWGWPPILGAVAGVFLLFPDGRLLSPRWRPMLWLAAMSSATAVIGFAFDPGPLTEFAVIDNPFGLEAASPVPELMGVVGMLGLGLALLGAGASLVLRFRRARGEQRQQLKWIAYAAGLEALALAASLLSFLRWERSPVVVVALVVWGLVAIPVAAAVAILRYRLYAIDRLINRTVVYGLLTALLGGTYAGAVLVGGHLFGGVGDEPPSWAVAGATLAVAAAFQPARRRIQNAVDRRFNRHRYDAARTVEAFSVRLRDYLDLDALTSELLAVVSQTVEPRTASLWLPPQHDRPNGPAGTRHEPAGRASSGEAGSWPAAIRRRPPAPVCGPGGGAPSARAAPLASSAALPHPPGGAAHPARLWGLDPYGIRPLPPAASPAASSRTIDDSSFPGPQR
jgi:hypothetical protein